MTELRDQFPDLPPLRPMLPLGDGRTVSGFSAPAEQALHWWQRLTAAATETGYRPLVMDPETPGAIVQDREDPHTFDTCLVRSADIDGAALLAERLRTHLDHMTDSVWRKRLQRELDGHGRWPDEPMRRRLDEVPSYRWHPTMAVLLAPVAESWQIPCLTGYGSWNGYPHPEEHAAILRYWHERYGAELLAMTNDTIDIAVTRPPATRAEALRAAWEFEMYNEGGYDEYGEDITDVAASLLGADVWLAWWD
jgi:hypothetical protein